MKQNGQRRGISGQDDQLADSTIERLSGLVGSFLVLLVVGSLLDKIENLLGESLIGLGPSGGVVLGHDALSRCMRSGYSKGSLLSSPEVGFLEPLVYYDKCGDAICRRTLLCSPWWIGGGVLWW